MTPQEAITEIDNEIAREQFSVLSLDREKPCNNTIIALEMAEQALEKQIPKRAKNVSDEGIERYVCDKCNNLMHRKQYYCDICGHALDWSDDK